MIIRNAARYDIPEVVAVHQKSFNGFFLTTLGPIFLKQLYYAFQQAGVLRVLCDENRRIVGFAGGVIEPEIFFRELRKEKGLVFFISALPGLIKNPIPVLKKVWYAVFYKGETPLSLCNAALLSSIGVVPEMAGRSFGKKLLIDFEEVVQRKGANSLYLTTDKYGNENVVAFYLKSGYQVDSEFVQSDGRIMFRLIKMFNGDTI